MSVSTIVWLHYLGSIEVIREKAWWGLLKNAAYCFRQILEVASNKKINWKATCLPSYKWSKEDEQDMLDTAREAGTNSLANFSGGLPQMDTPVLVDQQRFMRSVQTLDNVGRTYQER